VAGLIEFVVVYIGLLCQVVGHRHRRYRELAILLSVIVVLIISSLLSSLIMIFNSLSIGFGSELTVLLMLAALVTGMGLAITSTPSYRGLTKLALGYAAAFVGISELWPPFSQFVLFCYLLFTVLIVTHLVKFALRIDSLNVLLITPLWLIFANFGLFESWQVYMFDLASVTRVSTGQVPLVEVQNWFQVSRPLLSLTLVGFGLLAFLYPFTDFNQRVD